MSRGVGRLLVGVIAVVAGLSSVAVAGAAGGPAPSCAAGVCSVTLGYDGTTTQAYTTPGGVGTVTVAAFGAAGGGGSPIAPGGQGGEVSGRLAVASGSVLSVEVGGAGGAGTGGTFGGGQGYDGGGGFTAVALDATTVLIAGGGGGGGGASLVPSGCSAPAPVSLPGGVGGSGGQAAARGDAGAGGQGSSQPDGCSAGDQLLGGGGGGQGAGSSAGAGGLAGVVQPGGTTCSGGHPLGGGSGSTGASPAGGSVAGVSGGEGAAGGLAGGGGGGYAGGGGGGFPAADGQGTCVASGGEGGGGGGSSYAASQVSGVSYASGVQPGNGQVVISWTPRAPSVTISSPAAGGVYGVGSKLASAFTCTEGAGGPGVASCTDQDGHASGTALSTASAGTFTQTITATSADGLSTQGSVTYTVVAAPATSAKPTISGTARASSSLRCAPPAFSGGPTALSYLWERDSTPISGATGQTYKVATGDEGTTLTCVVTATGPGGTSAAITSARVSVPVPHVRGCPAASGSVHGTRIGPLGLGQTLSQVKHADSHASTRGSASKLFLCLTPTGIRVGFASSKELRSLPAHKRDQYRGRVIWISTANASYAISGVRPGATLAAARKKLHLSEVFSIGANDWYLAADARVTAVLKVRKGIVEEIGIAERALTDGSRASQRTFLTSFG